jgi:hypothetical protein
MYTPGALSLITVIVDSSLIHLEITRLSTNRVCYKLIDALQWISINSGVNLAFRGNTRVEVFVIDMEKPRPEVQRGAF